MSLNSLNGIITFGICLLIAGICVCSVLFIFHRSISNSFNKRDLINIALIYIVLAAVLIILKIILSS